MGWVLERMPGSRSGLSRVSGIFEYLFYPRVFPSIPEYFRLFQGILDTLSFFGGREPNNKVFLTFIEGYPIPSHV